MTQAAACVCSSAQTVINVCLWAASDLFSFALLNVYKLVDPDPCFLLPFTVPVYAAGCCCSVLFEYQTIDNDDDDDDPCVKFKAASICFCAHRISGVR